MKKYILMMLIIGITAYFFSCEKDDICSSDTPTTPSLIVEFYNTDNRTELKNVTNLVLFAQGVNDSLPTFNNVSKIKIPLKTNANSTEYSFLWNYNTTTKTAEKLDTISFNYTKKDVFISRACGFKTLFYLNAENSIEIEPEKTSWIKGFDVITSNIENENNTHVKIYH
jgi:hypothetical protein